MHHAETEQARMMAMYDTMAGKGLSAGMAVPPPPATTYVSCSFFYNMFCRAYNMLCLAWNTALLAGAAWHGGATTTRNYVRELVIILSAYNMPVLHGTPQYSLVQRECEHTSGACCCTCRCLLPCVEPFLSM
jgi:hypothetical protein